MRRLRHLPPFLRVVGALGLLLPVAMLVLLGIAWLSYQAHPSVDPTRLFVVALNLGMLGGACSFVVGAYNKRFNQPMYAGRTLHLNSWPGQVRVIGLLTALPLCAIILAAIIPPEVRAFEFVFPLSIVAAFVLLGSIVAGMASSHL